MDGDGALPRYVAKKPSTSKGRTQKRPLPPNLTGDTSNPKKRKSLNPNVEPVKNNKKTRPGVKIQLPDNNITNPKINAAPPLPLDNTSQKPETKCRNSRVVTVATSTNNVEEVDVRFTRSRSRSVKSNAKKAKHETENNNESLKTVESSNSKVPTFKPSVLMAYDSVIDTITNEKVQPEHLENVQIDEKVPPERLIHIDEPEPRPFDPNDFSTFPNIKVEYDMYPPEPDEMLTNSFDIKFEDYMQPSSPESNISELFAPIRGCHIHLEKLSSNNHLHLQVPKKKNVVNTLNKGIPICGCRGETYLQKQARLDVTSSAHNDVINSAKHQVVVDSAQQRVIVDSAQHPEVDSAPYPQVDSAQRNTNECTVTDAILSAQNKLLEKVQTKHSGSKDSSKKVKKSNPRRFSKSHVDEIIDQVVKACSIESQELNYTSSPEHGNNSFSGFASNSEQKVESAVRSIENEIKSLEDSTKNMQPVHADNQILSTSARNVIISPAKFIFKSTNSVTDNKELKTLPPKNEMRLKHPTITNRDDKKSGSETELNDEDNMKSPENEDKKLAAKLNEDISTENIIEINENNKKSKSKKVYKRIIKNETKSFENLNKDVIENSTEEHTSKSKSKNKHKNIKTKTKEDNKKCENSSFKTESKLSVGSTNEDTKKSSCISTKKEDAQSVNTNEEKQKVKKSRNSSRHSAGSTTEEPKNSTCFATKKEDAHPVNTNEEIQEVKAENKKSRNSSSKNESRHSAGSTIEDTTFISSRKEDPVNTNEEIQKVKADNKKSRNSRHSAGSVTEDTKNSTCLSTKKEDAQPVNTHEETQKVKKSRNSSSKSESRHSAGSTKEDTKNSTCISSKKEDAPPVNTHEEIQNVKADNKKSRNSSSKSEARHSAGSTTEDSTFISSKKEDPVNTHDNKKSKTSVKLQEEVPTKNTHSEEHKTKEHVKKSRSSSSSKQEKKLPIKEKEEIPSSNKEEHKKSRNEMKSVKLTKNTHAELTNKVHKIKEEIKGSDPSKNVMKLKENLAAKHFIDQMVEQSSSLKLKQKSLTHKTNSNRATTTTTTTKSVPTSLKVTEKRCPSNLLTTIVDEMDASHLRFTEETEYDQALNSFEEQINATQPEKLETVNPLFQNVHRSPEKEPVTFTEPPQKMVVSFPNLNTSPPKIITPPKMQNSSPVREKGDRDLPSNSKGDFDLRRLLKEKRENPEAPPKFINFVIQANASNRIILNNPEQNLNQSDKHLLPISPKPSIQTNNRELIKSPEMKITTPRLANIVTEKLNSEQQVGTNENFEGSTGSTESIIDEIDEILENDSGVESQKNIIEDEPKQQSEDKLNIPSKTRDTNPKSMCKFSTFKFLGKSEVKRPPTRRPIKFSLLRSDPGASSTSTLTLTSTPTPQPQSCFKVPMQIKPPPKVNRYGTVSVCNVDDDVLSILADTHALDSVCDAASVRNDDIDYEEEEEEQEVEEVEEQKKEKFTIEINENFMDKERFTHVKDWLTKTVDEPVPVPEPVPEPVIPSPPMKKVSDIPVARVNPGVQVSNSEVKLSNESPIIPPAEEKKAPLDTGIFNKLCHVKFKHNHCQRKHCYFQHTLPNNWQQALKTMSIDCLMQQYKNTKDFKLIKLYKLILPVVAGQLGAANDFNNLTKLVKDVLEINMYTDREPLIKVIIQALIGNGFSYYSTVEIIFRSANVEPNYKNLLCDILLNLTVERKELEDDWPIILMLSVFKKFDVDKGIIQFIIIEAFAKTYLQKELILKVYNDLIKKIPDFNMKGISSTLCQKFIEMLRKYNLQSDAEDLLKRCISLNILVKPSVIRVDYSKPPPPIITKDHQIQEIFAKPQTPVLTNELFSTPPPNYQPLTEHLNQAGQSSINQLQKEHPQQTLTSPNSNQIGQIQFPAQPTQQIIKSPYSQNQYQPIQLSQDQFQSLREHLNSMQKPEHSQPQFQPGQISQNQFSENANLMQKQYQSDQIQPQKEHLNFPQNQLQPQKEHSQQIIQSPNFPQNQPNAEHAPQEHSKFAQIQIQFQAGQEHSKRTCTSTYPQQGPSPFTQKQYEPEEKKLKLSQQPNMHAQPKELSLQEKMENAKRLCEQFEKAELKKVAYNILASTPVRVERQPFDDESYAALAANANSHVATSLYNVSEVKQLVAEENFKSIMQLIIKHKTGNSTDAFLAQLITALIETPHNYPTFFNTLSAMAALVNDNDLNFMLRTIGVNLILFLCENRLHDSAWRLNHILTARCNNTNEFYDIYNHKIYFTNKYNFFRRILIIAEMYIMKGDIQPAWNMLRDNALSCGKYWQNNHNEKEIIFRNYVLGLLFESFKKIKNCHIALDALLYLMKHMNTDTNIRENANSIIVNAINNRCSFDKIEEYMNNNPDWYQYLGKNTIRAILVTAILDHKECVSNLYQVALNLRICPQLMGNEKTITLYGHYHYAELQLYLEKFFQNMVNFMPITEQITILFALKDDCSDDEIPLLMQQYNSSKLVLANRVANILENIMKPPIQVINRNTCLYLDPGSVNKHLLYRQKSSL